MDSRPNFQSVLMRENGIRKMHSRLMHPVDGGHSAEFEESASERFVMNVYKMNNYLLNV